MSTAAASPFSPRVVLGMLLFGAIAFIAALWLAGAGQTGGDPNDGGGHAGATGLNGYAAFVQLLERDGYHVTLSRSAAQLEGHSLLVLTPPLGTDVKELNRIIGNRRYSGPTLVILPKWLALKLPAAARLRVKARPGWVMLLGSVEPKWAADLFEDKALQPKVAELKGDAAHWRGFGLEGSFPDASQVLTADGDSLVSLARDGNSHTLAGYWNDGPYPKLAEAAGVSVNEVGKGYEGLAPVVILAEPDLADNYGLADRNRALLALAIVDAATNGDRNLPVTFDLTLDGLGSSRNLLTLAFSPPFLAATLCLILAALVIGWRGYRRFGPPLAEGPAFAFGKRQLAVNGAALIQRSRRLHLLAAPYAAIVRNRIAALLGLRLGDDPARGEAEIDRLLEARGLGPAAFSTPAEALRHARGAHDLLRFAHTLKQLERSLSP